MYKIEKINDSHIRNVVHTASDLSEKGLKIVESILNTVRYRVS
jgi:hypothetical protein